jgi:PIN domain nuclease of toxin-antitoxin system
MRILLDTQCFLWYVLDDPQLSSVARAAIDDPEADVLVSPVSFWELSIKISLGKYSLTVPYEMFWREGMDGNGFQVLPIELRHTAALCTLPFHHRDPFDRLLVAQALTEDIPIASSDAILDAYGIRRVW